MGERGNEYYFAPDQLSAPVGTATSSSATPAAGSTSSSSKRSTCAPRTSPGGHPGRPAHLHAPGTYQSPRDLPTHAQRGMVGQIVIAASARRGPRGPGHHASRGAGHRAPARRSPRTAPATGATRPLPPARPRPPPAPAPPPGAPSPAPPPAACPFRLPRHPHPGRHGLARGGAVPGGGRSHALPPRRPSGPTSCTAPAGSSCRDPLFVITGTYQTIYNPFVTITDFETAEAFRPPRPTPRPCSGSTASSCSAWPSP